ncbi:hypothetical protein D3C76_1667670 [compost metagenome]
MCSKAIDTYYYTAVLHHVVGPQQLRTHCPYVRAQKLRHHFFQPAAVDDFDIVVHQANHVTCYQGCSAVIDGRIIEREWVAKHCNPALTQCR